LAFSSHVIFPQQIIVTLKQEMCCGGSGGASSLSRLLEIRNLNWLIWLKL
jgi:hypothetical protein